MVLDFLAVDNFDFTRKNVKKNLGEKLVKMRPFLIGFQTVCKPCEIYHLSICLREILQLYFWHLLDDDAQGKKEGNVHGANCEFGI